MMKALGIAVIGLAAAASPSAAMVNLQLAVTRADAVVVARSSDGVELVNRVAFKLTVVRTLHGEPVTGQILNTEMKVGTGRGLNPVKDLNGLCALFLLKRTESAWEAAGPGGNSPFFFDGAMPLGDCEAAAPSYTEGASVFENCMEEIALATRSLAETKLHWLRLYDNAAGSTSPVVARIMNEFSRSDVPYLRDSAIAWRTAQGDVTALAEVAAAAEGGVSRTSPIYVGATNQYLNTDPAGVMALGKIVLSPDAPDDLKHSAAHALRRIHTVEAVPYLGEMLDSTKTEIRTEAVAGLSEYVLGVRSVPDGPEKAKALDEAMNPGRRKVGPPPVEQEYLHMGRFRDSSHEASVVTFWRQWWQTHKAEFPPIQKQ